MHLNWGSLSLPRLASALAATRCVCINDIGLAVALARIAALDVARGCARRAFVGMTVAGSAAARSAALRGSALYVRCCYKLSNSVMARWCSETAARAFGE